MLLVDIIIAYPLAIRCVCRDVDLGHDHRPLKDEDNILGIGIKESDLS
jgi:hypothetical protein